MDDTYLSEEFALSQWFKNSPSNFVASQEGAEIYFAACAIDKDNPQPHAGQDFCGDHPPRSSRHDGGRYFSLQVDAVVLHKGTASLRTRSRIAG